MNDLERLQEGRAYLSDPTRWSRGSATQVSIDPRGHVTITARCAMAALHITEPEYDWITTADPNNVPVPSAYRKLANAITISPRMDEIASYPRMRHGPQRPEAYIAHFNDTIADSHAEILAMFDRAIATEKQRVASPSLVPELMPELADVDAA